jgi:hypothetical protein
VSSLGRSTQKFLAIGLIVIGFVVVGLFGLRAFHALRGFHGHAPFPPPEKVETDVSLIRDWMTVPFIGRMYHVPGKVLFDALSIPAQGNLEKSLNDINREYYPDQNGFVIEKVMETVLANQPPLSPEASGTSVPPQP